MKTKTKSPGRLVERRYLVPFILLTFLFALWGFANDITNPMVAAFQTVMELSAAKASMVQFAFYGGYATMAIPAALFIRRFSYKSGIMLGLGLYAIGAFLFIPAAAYQQFSFFCLSLYILTFGLAFLETTSNPYILSLGSKETSTRRLNLAQSFNPIGSLSGMAVASLIVLPNLWSDRRNDAGEIIFPSLDAAEKSQIRLHDLAIIRDPYVALGLVVLAILVVMALTRMPRTDNHGAKVSVGETMRRIWADHRYSFGVVAQMFYVAAQIMVWTFIIQYADNLGISKAVAQNYNILAMCLFLIFRFLGTFLMHYFRASRLLAVFGICAACLTAGTIFIVGFAGLICLVGISAFMSIMFPSIYGIALECVHERDTSLGAAFLVMAIVGGALMPPLQGLIIDRGTVVGLPAVNVSFILPLICFVVVTAYGLYTSRTRK
ncbi:MAG: L-fucose:H+ symporter permease [Bacteroides sp.]|nr:L-fucose:H+ symporter permease [Bacteroides sp.]